jgi:prephenate dehydrogenase
MPKLIMAIVGFGPMGRRFTRLFAQEFDVRVTSSRDVEHEVVDLGGVIANDRCSIISSSDYIVLAVPLTALPELIDEVNIHAKADAVVMDCCSARVPAEQALQVLNHQHFGLHDVRSGEYCVTGEIDEVMVSFFERHGIGIKRVSAEEHDRLNAVVGLGHFIGLSMGRFLCEGQKDILSGIGSGAKLMSLVNGLARNTPTTWRETQIDNQYTRDLRESFLDALMHYHEVLSSGEYPFGRDSEPSSVRDGAKKPRHP